MTGHFLRSAQQVGLAMAASPGVTLECGARCLEAGSDCPAFTLDYNSMKCFKLDRNTQGRGSELSAREGQSYFEKICLRGKLLFYWLYYLCMYLNRPYLRLQLFLINMLHLHFPRQLLLSQFYLLQMPT